MRQLRIGATVAAVVLAVTACSGGEGDSAVDPGGSGGNGPMPTESVGAPGEVTTRWAVTVMDTGRPELCLGAVAESYPPQCGGPPIEGWDWADHDGDYDQQGDVRWGVFSVTGTWDGTTFAAASAEPGDGTIPAQPELPPPPDETLPPGELRRIAEEVGELGGATGGYADDTRVFVELPYDDGSLQEWVDEEYGAGVVVVSSALVDR